MDIATIIGLISSLVTIEEAGRGWASGLFHFCKKERAKKKIVFVEWDAEDETTQRIIDAFKCGMAAKYKEHIFQPDEIDTIIEEFFKEKMKICQMHTCIFWKCSLDLIAKRQQYFWMSF